MNSAPQRQILLTALGCVIALALVWLFSQFEGHNFRERSRITVGLIYYGDESIAYTRNFIQAQHQLEVEFGSRIATVALRNVPEADVATHLQWLIDQGCNLIVTTSYGYSKVAREMAQRHPGVVFCQATGDNANLEPLVPNYHTFMGSIYQGRYATGVAAGLKLKELIDKGALTPDKAVLGYVAAYPVPEVISGYTAISSRTATR